MIQMTEQEFQMISLFVRQKYGINLSKKKYLIESKLWIELARAHVRTYTEYWQKLRADKTGRMEQRMMDLLTTNYSYFLREGKHFEFIQKEALSRLPRGKDMTLRVFCAGCAAGQEVYTTAMYLMDAKQMGYLKYPFEVVGADLSELAIQDARRGMYRSDDYARLPEHWRECYCEPFRDGQFAIRSNIRERVRFFQHNLMEPLPCYREVFQIVFCRNVLIYIHDPERGRVLKHIVDTLHAGGYLFLGHTESLMQGIEQLMYVQPAVYRKGGEL